MPVRLTCELPVKEPVWHRQEDNGRVRQGEGRHRRRPALTSLRSVRRRRIWRPIPVGGAERMVTDLADGVWTGTPLDRQRTNHLARLELSLVA